MKRKYSVQIVYDVPNGALTITHHVIAGSPVGALQAALRIGPPTPYMDFVMGSKRITIKPGRLIEG